MGNYKELLNIKILCRCLALIATISVFYAYYTDFHLLAIGRTFPLSWEINNLLSKSTSHADIPPNKKMDEWHFVDENVYVYSAYWEYRSNPSFVRIIGIGLTKRASASYLKCLLRYNDTNIATSEVEIKTIRDNHGAKHSATFYLCQAQIMPREAAIIARDSDNEPIWLEVHNTKPIKNLSEGKAAICVRPFFGKFRNNNLQVVEFLAFHQLMGVTQFTFYDYKTHVRLKEFLLELKRNDLPLQLLPWNLPNAVKRTWMFGQLASIADCVYRCAHSYEFVVILDVDEFIVPSQNLTLQQLVQNEDGRKSKKYSNYMFRSAYFCMEYPDDPEAGNITLPLLTQKKTRYRKGIFRPYKRCKSVVRPTSITMPGIHFTQSFLEPREGNVVINPSVAMLNHYRRGMCGSRSIGSSVLNQSAKKYRDLLLRSKPIQIWQKLNH